MSKIVAAEGQGSIAIGGDAINSIFVTGGSNQFFIGQYERLAEAYLDPRPLYRELQLDQFTGRTWLVQAIEAFVSQSDRGYIVIEAEAGMGKTAFMAWVARERRYIHHFVRLMPDANDVGVALRNLAAQLIRAWDLQSRAVGGVLPANAGRPDFFEELLFEAAVRRDAARPGEPIVIAVDGLNETAASSIRNPLGLPSDLPTGVFVLVSQRTVHVPFVMMTPRRVIRIRADGPENEADIRAYVETALQAPDLQQRITVAGIAHDNFARQLAEWCGGVWLVLRYALAELRSGARAPGDLSSLPVGLWQYYARFWYAWQQAHADTWSTVDLPLLVTVAVVREPMSLEQLCAFSACADTERAELLLTDTWRPYLRVQEGAIERYAAFHDSLDEFVAGRVDTTALTSAERPFVQRLAVAERQAHQRVSEHYLDAWGGLAQGLPGLRGDAANLDDGYGMRHLVQHLVHANADPVLHSLMQLEWQREPPIDGGDSSTVVNAWYEMHAIRRAFALYALDVQRAWEQVQAYGAPGDARSIALELRYALIAASVNSVAGNVPAELLLALVDDGVVIIDQALELAREVTDQRARAEALTALLPRLTGERYAATAREALASVQLVPDGYWRVGELARLAPVLGPEYREDLRLIASSLTKDYDREMAQRVLAPARDAATPIEGQGSNTFSFDPTDPQVFAAQYQQRTHRAVATLLLGVDAASAPAADTRRYVDATRFVESSHWQAELLNALAREAAAPDTRRTILQTALSTSLTVGDRDQLTAALASVAASLARAGDVTTALACLSEVRDPEARADALFSVAVETADPQREDVVRQAAEAAATITNAVARGEILYRHGARFGFLNGDELLERLLSSLSEDWRGCVLGAMAEGVPAAEREDLLTRALALAVASAEPGRARAITDLIDRLTVALLPSGRAAVETIVDTEERDAACVALVSRLAQTDRQAGEEIMRTMAGSSWLAEAQFGFACGLAGAGQYDEAALFASRLLSTPHRAEALARAQRPELAFELVDAERDAAARVVLLLRINTAAGSPGARNAVEEARLAVAEVVDRVQLPPLVAAVSRALADAGRSSAALEVIALLPLSQRSLPLIGISQRIGPAVADGISMAEALPDPIARAQALASLTGPLVVSGTGDVQGHVRHVLRLLAAGTRAQLLATTPDLVPGLLQAAGLPGLVDMATAITTASRWWP